MSRIVGLFSKNQSQDYKSIVKSMVVISCFKDNWSSHINSSELIALGWCGWKKQNISNEENIMCVIDGCIYNKNELKIKGNDAEIVINLYKEWGFEGSIKKLNGDFAIALYDNNIKTLWIARDRFGIKPLYYVSNKDLFAFASRPKALLELPNVSNKVNKQFVAVFAAGNYRYFDNDPEKTPYDDIMQLPASHILKVTPNEINKINYWSLKDMPEFDEAEEKLANKYRDLLVDSVKIRLENTENPAFTLSGGMDSSSVLSCAVQITNQKQDAFSTIYTDKTYDESNDIKSITQTKVREWHTINVDNPDVFSLVEEMIDLHDEPVATSTWLSHFLLCKEVKRLGFDSLFGGLGGDELNAGEYEHFFYHFADLKLQGKTDKLNDEVKMWIKYHDHPIFKKSLEVMEEQLNNLVGLSKQGFCLSNKNYLERYIKALNPEYAGIIQNFKPLNEHRFKNYLKNKTAEDIFRQTIPCCLRAEDRNTTAFGLNNLLPFFDYRLVEFMFRISGRLKIRKGITKCLLRKAMSGILPEETRTRIKKTGWNAPSHLWFCGKGKEKLLDLVNSYEFKSRGIYNVEEVKKIIEEHEQIVLNNIKKENHMMFLWQLVNLELWLRWLKQ